MFNVKNLDWLEIVEKMRSFTTSDKGQELVSKTSPLKNAEQAEKSFYDISCAMQVLMSGVRPHMQSLDLFDFWISRVRKNAVLKTLELKDIRHFCLESLALSEALQDHQNAWAKDTSDRLMKAEEPLSAIDNLITPNGEIRMDASEKLYRLFKEKESLARQIQNHMDKLVKDHSVEHMLQEKFVTTREGRWVIPVKGGMQHFVSGVIHGSSQTKQTVYIEPETVIPMNNRIRQIEVEIEDEIERLLTEISAYLSTLTQSFDRNFQILLSCDVLFAKAQLSHLLDASPCHFQTGLIELKELSHPLLKLSGKPIISNTVIMKPEKAILILSGPNAGGKTVLLKAIGLAAQMARCGLLICTAQGSSLPFFEEIATGIGDSQSVDEDLSTFAAHLKILDNAAKLTGSQHLILIDEICGSTDPEEGSALARAFIEKFAANSVFAVITSHLSPLKMGWKETDVILNASLEYDTKIGRPTYQFLSGIPGESLAIQTAKRVGVASDIVANAIENLSPTAKARQNQLSEFESLKKDIALLQENLKTQLKKAQLAEQDYKQKIEDFEKEKDNKLHQTLKKASTQVDDAIATVSAAGVLEKHRKLQEIRHQLPEIIKASPQNLNSSPNGVSIQSADEFAKKFPPGSKVYVTSLNQDAVVQSKPNAKGEVLVLSQSLRLQLHWSELKPPIKSGNPTQSLARRNSKVQVTFVDTDRTLDLRGKTVDEAISELEDHLDRATELNEDRLKIIHGHGTEVLKKSIRTYLSRSVYVKKWKAGNSETGGDGVTWVELGQI